MAMSLNRVQVIGNLTRDPEMKQIPGGQVVVNFSVATNSTWTDKDGNKQEKAEFHNIVAWRKLAEIIGQYLKKGSKVFIEGKLQTRSWEGEDGIKRYRTEIVADNMIMLDSKGAVVSDRMPAGIAAEQAPAPTEAMPVAASAPDSAPTEAKKEEVTIDDLPF